MRLVTPRFELESLYSRTEHISGMPLTDGYDFAQTQFNDFGRPYGEGWNTVNGFSAYATYGHWVVYVRGEAQTAPSIPALPLSAREVIPTTPGDLPLPPATPQPAVSQFAAARYLCRADVVELADFFWQAELVVGNGRGHLVRAER